LQSGDHVRGWCLDLPRLRPVLKRRIDDLDRLSLIEQDARLSPYIMVRGRFLHLNVVPGGSSTYAQL
jgi:hypothetical protein